jgi:hypothetical protein
MPSDSCLSNARYSRLNGHPYSGKLIPNSEPAGATIDDGEISRQHECLVYLISQPKPADLAA